MQTSVEDYRLSVLYLKPGTPTRPTEGVRPAPCEWNPSQQESLARLLHELGAVLHFVDEPRLRDTSVRNPHWVTDGVYRLLRFKDGPGSDGTLTLAEALAALPGETEEAARFLLRLPKSPRTAPYPP